MRRKPSGIFLHSGKASLENAHVLNMFISSFDRCAPQHYNGGIEFTFQGEVKILTGGNRAAKQTSHRAASDDVTPKAREP